MAVDNRAPIGRDTCEIWCNGQFLLSQSPQDYYILQYKVNDEYDSIVVTSYSKKRSRVYFLSLEGSYFMLELKEKKLQQIALDDIADEVKLKLTHY